MINRLTTSVMLSIAVTITLAVTSVHVDVFAQTPAVGGTLDNNRADLYFHSSLNNLNIDGSTGQFTKAKRETQDAMSEWNSQTADVTLYTTNSYQGGDHVVYAANLGLFGYSGQATYPNSDENYVRYNTWRHFGTSGGCNSLFGFSYAYNLEWLANHELGHTVGLGHAPIGDDSVMVPYCASSMSEVQEQDAYTLDLIY